MDFGSFLSSAGRIGEGIERYQTESEQRRLAQQQAALAREQLARAELNRQKEAERIAGITFDAPPRIEPALSVTISEPEANLSALSAAGAAAPAPVAGLAAPAAPGAPGAPATRTAGLATPSARAGRPTGQSNGSGFGGARTGGRRPAPEGVRFGGVVVPGFSSADPVRLNTFGGQGFRRVDPQASTFERGRVERENGRELNRRLWGLYSRANEPFNTGVAASVRGYFASAEEQQRLDRSRRAAEWYQSPQAREYFMRNPEMLAVAEADPLGFKEAMYRASDVRASSARAERAERANRPTSAPLTPATPATPSVGVIATPAGSTRRAQNFDRQGPQWDGVIQQAAAQFGVDPVILKRLLASESNFLTTNNSGQVNRQSGALGPAQIMPIHIQRGIVTEEQARDPTIAIYFMAAHLAQNLRNEGGNYEMALLRYKGAISPRGIASMTPVVRDITSGFQWDEAQVMAAVGPQLARTRDPATNASVALRTLASGGTISVGNVSGVRPRGGQAAGGGGQVAGGQAFGGGGFQVSGGQTTPVPVRMDPSSFYLANPNATTLDIDAALRQRAELVEMATIYQQTGSTAEFRAVQQQIRAVDNSLYFLQGMQGVQELELANDPRRLSAVWSQFAGVPIQLQPQTDGTYNILVNDQITQRGVSRSAIIASARSSFDREFAQAQAAAAAQQTALYLASQLRMSENMAEITAKAFADIQLKLLEGENASALELVRQMDPNGRITALPGDTGRAVLQVQGQTFIIDQGGVQVQGAPEGVTSAPSAQPLAGLSQRTVAVGTGG